jgi:hypothetical protein
MILDRRQFLGGIPALGPGALAVGAEPAKPRFYILEQFFLENGSQPVRIHEFFSKSLLPALDRVHKGPKLVLEALVTPQMPQVALIMGLDSIDQVWSVSNALFSDKDFNRAFEQWEAGEAPYVSNSASLLEATDYSPPLVALEKPPATPRIFELRVYHSPTARQWRKLHERFRGPEIKIFHRVGVHPVLYSSSVFGPDRPNLTYLIPFDNLAAREKAWNAFGADEEWLRVRKQSIEEGGQISARMNISLYRATAYSPIR